MSQKQLTILVTLIFGLVALGFFINSRRQTEVGATLIGLSRDRLASVRFVEDPLRASAGLDLPVIADDDLDAFVAALHTLRATNRSIKSLDVLATTTIALELVPADSLVLAVHRTTQTGETGVVSITRAFGPGEVSAGTFDSAELLAWVEAMAREPGFERIREPR